MLNFEEILNINYSNKYFFIREGKLILKNKKITSKFENFMFDEFCVSEELNIKYWKQNGVCEHFKFQNTEENTKLRKLSREIEELRNNFFNKIKEMI